MLGLWDAVGFSGYGCACACLGAGGLETCGVLGLQVFGCKLVH